MLESSLHHFELLQNLMESSELILVTSDSASMVFEAVTTGATVIIIYPGISNKSRVASSLESLIATGKVQSADDPLVKLTKSAPILESRNMALMLIKKNFI